MCESVYAGCYMVFDCQSLSIMNGITCAAYNGSVVESAARLLVDTVGLYFIVSVARRILSDFVV